MKKSLTILALAFGVTGAYAQDLTSKKGEPILPEAGDWSIGVDATPFLDYMGNFFGKSANNTAPTFNFLNTNQTITGKYFAAAQTAYRASVRIGFGGTTIRQMVEDRFQTQVNNASPTNNFPTVNPMKENEWKHSTSNIGLSAGIEKRKGKTRLQGFYGAELGFNISSSKDKFTYGNALNPLSAATSTSNPVVDVDNDDSFGGSANNVYTAPTAGGPLGRVTERKNGTTFSFGVRGFIGVEYFVLPKISLGGEFGWGLGLATQGKSKTTMESIGNTGGAGANDQTGTTTIESSKNGGFRLDTDNTNSIFGPSASLRLNFHF